MILLTFTFSVVWASLPFSGFCRGVVRLFVCIFLCMHRPCAHDRSLLPPSGDVWRVLFERTPYVWIQVGCCAVGGAVYHRFCMCVCWSIRLLLKGTFKVYLSGRYITPEVYITRVYVF